ncbi:MAG TPA: phosphoenolpyruvate carboxykinase (ATP), partial [Armatimonadetes bacterium]|nr:phosphoenolpyruvate carboxykinase (ATP) [Armatimonadota bacterium]
LVNTGWTGGPYGVGKRMDLKYTRAMITAALAGQLDNVRFEREPVFQLEVPTSVPGVPNEVLMPRETWADKDAYDRQANDLHAKFVANAAKFGL